MFSGFMANAWEVATVVAVVAGVVGFFVVMRGAAFPAHAIPNGASSASIRSSASGSSRWVRRSGSVGSGGGARPMWPPPWPW
jgi:zinc/manganese transport system permease protein